MILVVGATGQLGTAITRKLIAAQQPVRAFVRRTSDYQHLQALGVELAFGDLRDPATVQAACQGVTTVITTANGVIQRKGDSIKTIDGDGNANLIEAAKQQEVQQFIYASVPVTPFDQAVPALKYKRLTEERLQASGLNYTIVRLSVFMDVWLALLGSHVPTRGAEQPTVKRPFWFSQLFMAGVGGMVEGRGLALVPGNGKARHAFITVDDAARALVACVGHPVAQHAILHVGGPEILSWDETVTRFGQAVGRKVRSIHLPIAVARVNQALLSPLGDGPANIMGMIRMTGAADSAYPTTDADRLLDGPLTTMQEFLAQKVNLPAGAATTGNLKTA
jgi:NADH dehydrogenase